VQLSRIPPSYSSLTSLLLPSALAMATSRHVMLLLVACTLAVLIIGSAEAGYCKPGYADCDKKHGCETNILNDVRNCGRCYNVCTPPKHAQAYCKKGDCYYVCKHPFTWSKYKKLCVKYHGH